MAFACVVEERAESRWKCAPCGWHENVLTEPECADDCQVVTAERYTAERYERLSVQQGVSLSRWYLLPVRLVWCYRKDK